MSDIETQKSFKSDHVECISKCCALFFKLSFIKSSLSAVEHHFPLVIVISVSPGMTALHLLCFKHAHVFMSLLSISHTIEESIIYSRHLRSLIVKVIVGGPRSCILLLKTNRRS